MDPATNDLDVLLTRWRREVFGNAGANPVPILTSIAELIERETEIYLKLPIDPFDDRHPSRTSPDCSLGLVLKALFKNENFMSQLTTEYLTSSRSNFELHVVSCRLLLDILPGLDSTVVFMETDTLVKQLLEWAEKAEFPLHSYATGLLGAAMEVPDISISYREQNNQIVPLMLNRLNQITQTRSDSPDQSSDYIDPRDLVDVSETTPNYKVFSKPLQRGKAVDCNLNTNNQTTNDTTLTSENSLSNGLTKNAGPKTPSSVKRPHCELEDETATIVNIPPKIEKRTPQAIVHRSPLHNECSSSSWAEVFMTGSYQMHPLSTVMQQRFILQYLSALGEYQELLIHMFEHKALSLILHFIDARMNSDVRLAFDALKFLAAFLTHKKFALEFLDHGGLLQLLRVNRHGMASAGVSVCLYYLAYNEDVMERICWMKREIVEKMVMYGLWLLERSPDSSRSFAAMFFSLCFQFPILLKLFDRDRGLRKLLNVISMRGLFSDDPVINELTDDELFSRRQTAKQVCTALKKYVRSHFVAETRRKTRMTLNSNDQECKPTSVTDENVMEAIELHRQQSMPLFNWKAIDAISHEDGINYLLKIIAHICNEGSFFAGKSETVRNALEILVVCSLSPKIQQVLLKETIRTNIPYPIDNPAIAVILMCADPKILDADCLKSALNILINLACSNHTSRVAAPSFNTSIDSERAGNSKKRTQSKSMTDLSIGLRKAIWANNGTLVLPKLLTVTSPLTEADAIRSLVCRVLCGLARDDSIRQIMSKLPLFTDGHLQSLMKEPILPEKRIEHADFCKHCKELIQLVTGTEVTATSGIEPSLGEIRRRMIVAQTKIDYDRNEAYHLIHNYLNSEGFPEVAASLYKAANLSSKPIKGCIGVSIPRNQPRSPPLTAISNSQSIVDSLTPQTPTGKLTPINQSTPAIVRSHLRTPSSALVHSNSRLNSLQMQKSTDQPSNLYKRIHEATNATPITLDSILTDYLRHQHSLCKNPVATCPPFELLAPHRCPEPINRLMAPSNITSRIIRRRVFAPRGGFNGAKFDRQYVYSKFRPVRLVRDTIEIRNSSTCCAFSSDGQYLFVGTDGGMLKAFNISNGLVEASYECHPCSLSYIEASHDDNLIITTSPDSPNPVCVLWTFTDVFERKQRFDNDSHAEFGKATSDRIVSTQELYARLWDTATGTLLQKYEGYHRYLCNRATLNYNDTLVLNDGVLWDIRTSSAIHKFAKFNERINGIFHPNGSEIICNSQIWDIRNFRLLKTVPAFDNCQLKFNSMGDVIFSIILDDQSEIISSNKNEFKTSFRTFDSHDYSTIATIDLKKTITDLAISSGDEHLGLVESSQGFRSLFQEDYMSDQNVCRLYEIGRSKYDAEGDEDDDDEDADADDEENDDDDDDDDDIDDEDDVDEDDDEEDELTAGLHYEDDDDDDDEDDDDGIDGDSDLDLLDELLYHHHRHHNTTQSSSARHSRSRSRSSSSSSFSSESLPPRSSP